MTFAVNLPTGRYADPERRAPFYREFEARLAALPGVRAAAAISRLPVTGSFHSWASDEPMVRPILASRRLSNASSRGHISRPLEFLCSAGGHSRRKMTPVRRGAL